LAIKQNKTKQNKKNIIETKANERNNEWMKEKILEINELMNRRLIPVPRLQWVVFECWPQPRPPQTFPSLTESPLLNHLLLYYNIKTIYLLFNWVINRFMNRLINTTIIIVFN
jgi:hypothetical protein